MGLGAKADRLAADAPRDDVVESDKRAAAYKENVCRIDLNVLLLRMLAAALRWDVGDSSFQHLQQGLLYAFAGDVARDGDVLTCLGNLVHFVDIDDAALSGLDVEVGRMQELQQEVFHVLADIA